MAKKVLISFVGKGQFADKDEAKKFASGYLPTTYMFNVNGVDTPKSSHIFVEALLESHMYEFSKIYLFGTNTSSWGMLIYDLAQKDEAVKIFWEELEESCSGSGIEDEQIERLEILLRAKYGVHVVIRAHVADIEEDSVDEVFNIYNSVAEEIPAKHDIIFDITHGFRSMPLLAYQSLLYNSATQQRRRIDIIYAQLGLVKSGENKKSISFVRNLGRYWELSEGALAVKLFKEKYDASMLVSLVPQYCAPVAELFRRFDDIVRFNLAHFVEPFMALACKILETNPLNEEWPLWMQDGYIELVNVFNSVGDGEPVSQMLMNFSALMHNKGLLVQSVIALRCAVEAKIIEQINPAKVGDYDFWEKQGKVWLKENRTVPSELKQAIHSLAFLRNLVAHGGGDHNSSAYAFSASALENKLFVAEKNVKKLFAILNGVDF